MNGRDDTWWFNKIRFDKKIEKIISYCPNMCGEDDMRDICERKCPLYNLYCISIEPSSGCLDGTTKGENE